MKVLIADKFEKVGIDGLKELGCTVVSQPDLTAEALPGAIREADPHILIVRGTKVSADALQAGTALTLVIRAGAGIDTIDVATASSRGIFVSNCPGKNSIAVAEIVMGLLLSCDRRIPDQVADLRKGAWNKSEYSKARGLYGRTLGIVGLGQIGREVAARAQAFGMRVLAWSRTLTHEEADRLGIAYAQSPLEVARLADAVTINVAANADTKNLVNAEFLSAMRPGAYLINTSRGSVVDEAALRQAIAEKKIRAGLDVFQSEPAGGSGTIGNEILQAPGVYGTHHVGASTDQAQVAIAHEVIRDRPGLPGDRRGAQRGEPPRPQLGEPRALDPPPQPARRPGPCLRRARGRGDQRRGSGEHHLSRRAGYPGADPSRRGAGQRRAGADQVGECRHHQRGAERDRRQGVAVTRETLSQSGNEHE